ncbi:phosphotransferase [Streptomyces sp. 4N509B]|uniref:phosphotransferase n=1 Tax=Streptomyces sp. 4N509B TaxID=3457413 RepID=UPI003FCF4C33
MPPSERTLTALLRRYGAGEPLACQPITQGLLNRGYQVATTRGRFFLKQHLADDPDAVPPPESVPPLAEQHRATVALAGLGLPVAPPLADRDGRTIAVHAGRRYALHPWIEGRHRGGGELNRLDCRRLGALLARVHRGLEHVMGPLGGLGQTGLVERQPGRAGQTPGRPSLEPVRPAAAPVALTRTAASPPPAAASGPAAAAAPAARAARAAPAAPAEPAQTHAVIDRLLRRVRGSGPRRTSFDELAEHRLLERCSLLREHADRRPDRSQTPARGWVHGDFHPLNLLYRADAAEPAAIIDWDRLGVQPRAEEVVRAAAIFFLRPDGGLALSKARAYARAYRHGTCTDAAEMAAAVHRVWWERLNDFWMLRWHYERGDHRADPQFPAASALVVWWTRNADAVRDAFCD